MVSESTLPEGFFDVVTMFFSLEHFYDPVRELGVTKNIMKDSGILIIRVPNIESLQAKLFGENWFQIRASFHSYHYSKKTLEKVLKKG